jgi:hypothetical protein
MKFSELLGDASEDAEPTTTTTAPDQEQEQSSVLGRPPGVPPLVEEVPVRFSPVPAPTLPPVPPYDDATASAEPVVPAEVPEYRRSLEPGYRAPEPAPDPEPLPEPLQHLEPEPVLEPLQPLAPEPLPEPARAIEAEPLQSLEPEPLPEPARYLEPEPLPEPEPEPLPEPGARVEPAPAPIAVLAPEPPAPGDPAREPLGPAPTAASVFGGQRGAELAAPVAPAEEPVAPDEAARAARFDLVDDDLLPAGRRRARR